LLKTSLAGKNGRHMACKLLICYKVEHAVRAHFAKYLH